MGEDILESRGDQAFGVHGDPKALHALWCCAFNSRTVGVGLSKDIVTPLCEHPKSNIEAGGTADGEGALPVLIGRVVDNLVDGINGRLWRIKGPISRYALSRSEVAALSPLLARNSMQYASLFEPFSGIVPFCGYMEYTVDTLAFRNISFP